jgi:hypothetical protein
MSPPVIKDLMLRFALIDINKLIIFFLVFNFAAWFHFAYYMSEEMCEFLKIQRFSIPHIKEE